MASGTHGGTNQNSPSIKRVEIAKGKLKEKLRVVLDDLGMGRYLRKTRCWKKICFHK